MRLFSILFLSLLVVGCSTSKVNNTRNTKAVKSIDFTRIKDIVVIPVKITVKESGIGSFEKLPEESRIASATVQQELKRILADTHNIKVTEFKPTGDKQIATLDEYIGLYQRVALSSEFSTRAGKAWSHKTGDGADYTLGKNIRFIKKATGVDKAIFVFGEDIVTSGGVKALSVLLLLAGGGANPGGIAVLHLGIVDLNDGALLWSNSIASQSMSLDNQKSVHSYILETLENSPLLKAE